MAGFRSRPKPLQAMSVERLHVTNGSGLAGLVGPFVKPRAVKSAPTPPSRPHPANPPPDIRRRLVTQREVQIVLPHRHRPKQRQQLVGE